MEAGNKDGEKSLRPALANVSTRAYTIFMEAA